MYMNLCRQGATQQPTHDGAGYGELWLSTYGQLKINDLLRLIHDNYDYQYFMAKDAQSWLINTVKKGIHQRSMLMAHSG